MLSVITLNVVMLSVITLNVVMLNVVMVNFVMLNVVMLSVVILRLVYSIPGKASKAKSATFCRLPKWCTFSMIHN